MFTMESKVNTGPTPYSLIDTGALCFICLRNCASTSKAKEDTSCNSSEHLHRFSLRSLSSYLKIKVQQDLVSGTGLQTIRSPSTNSLTPIVTSKCVKVLKKKMELDKAVKLCDGCFQEAKQFAKLYQQLIQTKMKISDTLGKIHRIMKHSQRDQRRILQFKQVMIPVLEENDGITGDQAQSKPKPRSNASFQFVETLRQQLLIKCEEKYAENHPKVVLPRLIKLSSKKGLLKAAMPPVIAEEAPEAELPSSDPQAPTLPPAPDNLIDSNAGTLEGFSSSSGVLDPNKEQEPSQEVEASQDVEMDLLDFSSEDPLITVPPVTKEEIEVIDIDLSFTSSPEEKPKPDLEPKLNETEPVIISIRGSGPGCGPGQSDGVSLPASVPMKIFKDSGIMELAQQVLPVPLGTRTHLYFYQRPTGFEVVMVPGDTENNDQSNQIISIPPKPEEPKLPQGQTEPKRPTGPEEVEVEVIEAEPEAEALPEFDSTDYDFPCKFCDAIFRSEPRMYTHVVSFHSDHLLAQYKAPGLTLTPAQFKFAVQRFIDNFTYGKLQLQKPLKTGQRNLFRCSICSSLERKQSLWQHSIENHFDSVSQAFLRFQEESKQVLTDYNGSLSFEINLFAKSFIDTGQKNPKGFNILHCKICEKDFVHLRFHRRYHGLDRINCEHCSETFTETKYKDMHVVEIHPDKMFSDSNVHSLPRNEFIRRIDKVFGQLLKFKKPGEKYRCELCPQLDSRAVQCERIWRLHMISNHRQFVSRIIRGEGKTKKIRNCIIGGREAADAQVQSMDFESSPVIISVEGNRSMEAAKGAIGFYNANDMEEPMEVEKEL